MKKLMLFAAAAASLAAAADMKVGTVDMMMLVRNHSSYEPNKKLLSDTEKDYAKKIDKMKADLEEVQEEGKKLSDLGEVDGTNGVRLLRAAGHSSLTPSIIYTFVKLLFCLSASTPVRYFPSTLNFLLSIISCVVNPRQAYAVARLFSAMPEYRKSPSVRESPTKTASSKKRSGNSEETSCSFSVINIFLLGTSSSYISSGGTTVTFCRLLLMRNAEI